MPYVMKKAELSSLICSDVLAIYCLMHFLRHSKGSVGEGLDIIRFYFVGLEHFVRPDT